MNLNILHISTSSSGGAGIAATRLHLGLLNEGVNSSILFLHNQKKISKSYSLYQPPGLLRKAIYKTGLFISQTEKNKKKLCGKIGYKTDMFTFPENDFKISNHPAVKNADIINLHWIADFVHYNDFFSKTNKPIVWTLHDQNPFTGGCHYSYECKKFEASCLKCPQLAGTTNLNMANENLFMKQKLYSKKDITAVMPSKWLTTEAQKSFLFKKIQYLTIPYGLNTDVFKPLDKISCRSFFNIPKNKKVILFISDKLGEERKGFRFIESIVNSLNRNDVIFLAVGINKGFNENEKIIFTGKIEDEETLAKAYAAADVFVLPSIADNLPNTMIESLCCGTPVIGFSVGGISDYVITGKTGILAAEINLSLLNECICEFINEKYRFDRNYIRDFSLANFKNSLQAKAYINLYNSIISKKSEQNND